TFFFGPGTSCRLSTWPSGFWGARRSRTNRFRAVISGNPPSALRSISSSPSIEIRNSPAVPARLSMTPPSSYTKVESNSAAIYVARNSQPHLGQYVMVMVGLLMFVFLVNSDHGLMDSQLLGHLASDVEECG